MRKLLICLLFFTITAFTVPSAYAFQSKKSGFCMGYERGFIAGYKKATVSLYDPYVPYCPFQPYKQLGDPDNDFEQGYLIGLEDGLMEGRR